MDAAACDEEEMVELLLRGRPDLDSTDKVCMSSCKARLHVTYWSVFCQKGRTALMRAAQHGAASIVTMLIEAGANVNAASLVWRCE